MKDKHTELSGKGGWMKLGQTSSYSLRVLPDMTILRFRRDEFGNKGDNPRSAII
jgi:hypothetical protein